MLPLEPTPPLTTPVNTLLLPGAVHVKANQSINHIPIIALTSKDKIKELLQTEGVEGYVVKPCKAEVLLEVVTKCLNEQETKTEENG